MRKYVFSSLSIMMNTLANIFVELQESIHFNGTTIKSLILNFGLRKCEMIFLYIIN